MSVTTGCPALTTSPRSARARRRCRRSARAPRCRRAARRPCAAARPPRLPAAGSSAPGCGASATCSALDAGERDRRALRVDLLRERREPAPAPLRRPSAPGRAAPAAPMPSFSQLLRCGSSSSWRALELGTAAAPAATRSRPASASACAIWSVVCRSWKRSAASLSLDLRRERRRGVRVVGACRLRSSSGASTAISWSALHGVALVDQQLLDAAGDLRADDDVVGRDDAGEDEEVGGG